MNEEIIENNRLVAEFMLLKSTNVFSSDQRAIPHINKWIKGYHIKGGIFVTLDIELKYHMSWDWLMPACYKWDRLYDGVKKQPKKYEKLCDALDNFVSCYEISGVYNQLVSNIKWYNSVCAKTKVSAA